MESKNPTSHNYKNHKNDSGPGFPSEQGRNVIPPSPVHPPQHIHSFSLCSSDCWHEGGWQSTEMPTSD